MGSDPTITTITNNGTVVHPHGNGAYCLHAGEIVVKGVAPGSGDSVAPQPVGVTAAITDDPGGPLPQVTPATVISYGPPDAAKNRPYSATWASYTVAGDGQLMQVKQIPPPTGFVGATFDVH